MPSENRPLHRRVELLLQSGDMRLIYGIAVPLVVVVGLIVALAISGRTILIIPLLFVLLVLTGVVVVGFNQMLEDDEDDDDDGPPHG